MTESDPDRFSRIELERRSCTRPKRWLLRTSDSDRTHGGFAIQCKNFAYNAQQGLPRTPRYLPLCMRHPRYPTLYRHLCLLSSRSREGLYSRTTLFAFVIGFEEKAVGTTAISYVCASGRVSSHALR